MAGSMPRVPRSAKSDETPSESRGWSSAARRANAGSVRQITPRVRWVNILLPTTPSQKLARVGGGELENGELLDAAEAAGFEVFVTADKNIRHQQNLTSRKIALVVLGAGRWSVIKPHVARVVAAVNAATRGSSTEKQRLPERPIQTYRENAADSF